MIYLIGYSLIILAELLFSFFFLIFSVSLLFSSIKGSPFVPTKNSEIDAILKEADLKKDKYFIDLGCGDGRVVRKAVKTYEIKGLGVDINLVLTIYARLLTWFSKIKNVNFISKNILDPSLKKELKKADYIYLFLMPELIEKFTPILKDNLRKNTVVISHGFKILDFDKLLFKTIPHKPFPTYFYKV